jgi:acyl-CoA synthetase (AMP-forming)/AMP-acid ligase II
VPSNAQTLQQLLFERAASDKTWLILPHDVLAGDRADRVSYTEMLRRSLQWAAVLRKRVPAPGRPVGLVLDNGASFCFAFFGALLAGLVPVPLPPPYLLGRREEYAARTLRILSESAAALALVDDAFGGIASDLATSGCPTLEKSAIEKLAYATGVEGFSPHLGSPEETCLIQYTSGSTREPRGVELTHRNVLANVRGIGITLEAHQDEVALCWLPLFHDLGLTATLLYSMSWNMSIVLMSPTDFALSPASWLWAISRFEVSGCAAPNFAYALCSSRNRIPDRTLEGLDLSTLHSAINAAEMVQPKTLADFRERFAAYGLREEALKPSYGLAEHVAACCAPPRHVAPRLDTVDRVALERQGLAKPVSPNVDRARTLPSVGMPLAGHELCIVDRAGRVAADRQVGEIHARGPSVMKGYYRNPAESARALGDDGWLKTGDLGYLAEGFLYVVGRIKDVIKKGGSTFDAADVLGVVSGVRGVRAGCVSVFGSADAESGTEQLVIVAETRLEAPSEIALLRQRIVAEVMRVLAVRPDAVHFVTPDTLPKSTSGKIKNAECRRRWLDGELVLLSG